MADSSASKRDPENCPQCGAKWQSNSLWCPLCEFELASQSCDGETPAAANQQASKPPTADPGGSVGFSLASLMLSVTLACVLLSVIYIVPGVGIPLAILALFVWARTIHLVSLRGRHGTPTASIEKVLYFIRSFSFAIAQVILICAVGFAAFLIALASACSGADFRQAYRQKTYAVLAGFIALVFTFVIFKLMRLQRRWRAEKIGSQDPPDGNEPTNPSTSG